MYIILILLYSKIKLYGEFSRALPLCERTLSIYEEFYVIDHELTLNSITNLAKLKKELVS